MLFFIKKFVLFSIIILFFISCNNNKITKQQINSQIQQIETNFKKYEFSFLDSSYKNLAKECNSINYTLGEEKMYFKLSDLYTNSGQLDSSLLFKFKILQIRIQFKDTAAIINSYLNIANDYASLKLPKNQFIYLQLTNKILKSNFNNLNLVRYNTSLGIYYTLINNIDSAKLHLKKAIVLSNTENNSVFKSTALLSYANLLLQIEDKLAIQYYTESKNIFYKSQNQQALASIYNNIAEYYWLTNNKDSILLYLQKGYIICLNNKFSLQMQNILYNLSFFYEEQGNFTKCILYREKLDSLNKEIYSEKMVNTIANVEKDYAVKFKTQENAKLKAQISKKNTIRNAAIVSTFLLILLGFYQYKNYKQKSKLIENEKQIKDQEIKQLLKENELKNIDALFEGREEERKRIGRDLHDRLGSILSTVKLHFSAIEHRMDNLKSENQQQYLKANSLLDEAVGEVRKIAHDLVSGTLVNNGLMAALLETKQTIEESGTLKVNLFKTGEIEYNNVEFEIAIYRILQELINNVIKHAKANKIDIYLTQTDTDFTLIVEDNGIGFINDISNKNGIGMANLKQRVQKLGGQINYDSQIGKGTSVIIEIGNKPYLSI